MGFGREVESKYNYSKMQNGILQKTLDAFTNGQPSTLIYYVESIVENAYQNVEKANASRFRFSQQNKELKNEISGLKKDNRRLEKGIKAINAELKAAIKEKSHLERQVQELKVLQESNSAEIEALKNQLKEAREERDRYQSILNNDSTNQGIPTSMTPLNKKKHNPNLREKTNRNKGGQPGHEKHDMKVEEIDEVVVHQAEDYLMDTSKYEFLREESSIEKDVIIIPKTIKHVYYVYREIETGRIIKSYSLLESKGNCHYGPNIKSLILLLRMRGYQSVERTQETIVALTNGKIIPSRGFISNVIRKASRGLEAFNNELIDYCINAELLYWDDTVISVDGARACFRVYCDEQISCFKGHLKKDMAGILEDGILQNKDEDTAVMHDHNKVNYNTLFRYINLECNVHLLRDLKKNTEDTCHIWSERLTSLIREAMHERKQFKGKGIDAFEVAYITSWFEKLDDIIALGHEENCRVENKYFYSDEKALLMRVEAYKTEYFAWIRNFELPTTNNMSERELRGMKTQSKVSGQFKSEKTAQEYATVSSYIRTAYKNGIELLKALSNIFEGSPYTLEKMLAEGVK